MPRLWFISRYDKYDFDEWNRWLVLKSICHPLLAEILFFLALTNVWNRERSNREKNLPSGKVDHCTAELWSLRRHWPMVGVEKLRPADHSIAPTGDKPREIDNIADLALVYEVCVMGVCKFMTGWKLEARPLIWRECLCCDGWRKPDIVDGMSLGELRHINSLTPESYLTFL